MLEDVRMMLERGRKEGYAVGAFNTINLETTHAILMAAQELRAPVIVQVTERTLDYAGGRAIFQMIKHLVEYYYNDIPVGIHLDHGKSVEIVEHAAEIGFPSVMYDGSCQSYEDNLANTKKIVELAHKSGVVVQAEVGNVPYTGEIEITRDQQWDAYMTDPDQALAFYNETGVDSFAVAIGNAHGFTRERSVPDYARLEKIAEKISCPLVLHGASDWEEERVRTVIECGISCFNVDTSTRMAFVQDLRNTFKDSGNVSFDLRKILGKARNAAKESIKEKIRMFGSEDKIL